MAQLLNNFSWSVSARDGFETCRRRRFLAKYAMWGGWKSDAPEFSRSAYRLGKMQNRFTLQGNAVERSVMWALRERREGRTVSVEEVYKKAARGFLNQCWKESKTKLWKQDPKKYCCLHEHYYPGHHGMEEHVMTDRMIETVKLCIANFLEKIAPRLDEVLPEKEIRINQAGNRDTESFELENVKIYSIPDYAYYDAESLHIHDWKSGSSKPSHLDQMAVYGLWAHIKHLAAPGSIFAHLEYLSGGTTMNIGMTKEKIEGARHLIAESVNSMSEYLVDRDLLKNRPLPKEEWELCAEQETCKKCCFYELCEVELEAS